MGKYEIVAELAQNKTIEEIIGNIYQRLGYFLGVRVAHLLVWVV